MGAFDQVHILTAGNGGAESSSESSSLIIAEAGCKTGDIVCKAMAGGMTLPLGSRPSVGAGLWLQGGIGHLSRIYGLACDAIIGAVVVSVDSSQVLCIGCVPSQHWPAGAGRPEDETDLLWAIKGAGTNVGIVISVTFKAFGPNRPRLARLKHNLDPRNVLAYACPLPNAPMEQKLIILVTGESCAGKDFCADIWVSVFLTCTHKSLKARAVSISDAIKREYAAASGANLDRLLRDRAYKEQHRQALTAFFQGQVQHRPRLPEEHFLDVVYDAVDGDVLLITGMRDEAPVAVFSHLVPYSRVLDVRVKASKGMCRARGGSDGGDNNQENNNGKSKLTTLEYRPSLVFNNDTIGNDAAARFAEHNLLPFFHRDLQRLANMVRSTPDFPRPGIEFRHVLDIAQQPGGLALCTSLLQTHFTGDWAKVDAIACCEAGGFIYASALASRVDVPLALIREAGKLPQPTVSAPKSTSYISSSTFDDSQEKRIEMGRDLIPRGASVVVVDDVLATGNTLCAVLRLLDKVGVSAENVSIVVVAEFPVHRGRELLRQHGFGGVNVQSLLIIGSA